MKSVQSRIFVSYSRHGDGPKWKGALIQALKVFEQHHLLDVWEDGKIRIGTTWDDDIKQAMNSACLAVLLLTKEALESEYIIKTEFPLLSERQRLERLPIVPVICEPCNWGDHEWLRATQSLTEAKPLSELSEVAQDGIFRRLATDIADELSRIVFNELAKGDSSPPPGRIYLHTFPLARKPGLHHEKLIGREQELTLLDLAFAQPHTAIISLVAWGGVGKTMLVQHWLQRLERQGWFGLRHVYAWSFYSQGTKEDRQASEDSFLSHALEWFGVQCEPTLSPWDKGRLLGEAVSREHTLLILDGIEPLQYPPGPMGGQLRAPGIQSLLKQLARKANDTRHGGLCLVTTREPLTDLTNFGRRPNAAWGSVVHVGLGNLLPEAGAALLHHSGAKRAGAVQIKAEDGELLAASREVDGHALTLHLLGRFLARGHWGDIRRRDLVKFEEADLKVQGGTTFKMLAAFESWFARSGEVEMRSLTVLRMLGLFDRPADAGCVAALRKPPILAGLTDPFFATRLDSSTGQETLQPLLDQAWNAANSFLVDFGLLDVQMSVDESKPLLDCHPLIREHFAKQLRDTKPEVWRASHRRLYEHLCATTNEGDRPALRDLQPLYQAVTHGCLAGLHQEVDTDVYFGRIKKEDEAYSSRILGSFGFDLGAIACFFEQPWSRVSPLLPADIQAWYLNDAAYRLRALGRLTDAIEPFRVSRELCVQQQDWRQAAIRAINLSELGLTLGDVAGAIVDAEQSVIYADRSNDEKWPSVTRAKVADALHQAGRREAAEARFREAEKMQAESQPDYPLLYAVRGFQYCDLLLKDAERAAWQIMCCNGLRLVGETIDHRPTLRVVADRAMQALKWEEGMPRTSLLNFALHHLTLGRAALYEAILDGRPDNPLPAGRSETIAERRAKDCVYLDHTIGELNTAVGGLRGSGNMDELPRGLLTRAWLRSLASLRTGTESAQGDLDDAWEIAERGPMKLFLTDIHLHRARLFFREKPYPWKTPQADLTDAEKLINDCGYHRRDEELNDAKRAILGA